jgi:hypothetical protein
MTIYRVPNPSAARGHASSHVFAILRPCDDPKLVPIHGAESDGDTTGFPAITRLVDGETMTMKDSEDGQGRAQNTASGNRSPEDGKWPLTQPVCSELTTSGQCTSETHSISAKVESP